MFLNFPTQFEEPPAMTLIGYYMLSLFLGFFLNQLSAFGMGPVSNWKPIKKSNIPDLIIQVNRLSLTVCFAPFKASP